MNEEQLEAEIERLNAHCKRMASDLVDIADDHSRLFHENARLKAEVERLTKAGDAMAEAMWYGDNGRSIWVKKFAETDWNAAKEGKGQP
jgi:uncharacterized small protein (DUF1192 family)